MQRTEGKDESSNATMIPAVINITQCAIGNGIFLQVKFNPPPSLSWYNTAS